MAVSVGSFSDSCSFSDSFKGPVTGSLGWNWEPRRARRRLTLKMLSRLALIVAIAFLAAPVLAQSPARTVSGTVVDADSRAPIPNARLSVSQTVVATDAAGRFTLSVPVGLVTVLVEAAGYFPLATGLSVPEAGLSGA